MIISLSGLSGAGKDTIADILVKKYSFKKVSYADPLKDACAAIFGWDRHLLNGDTQESREFRETRDEFWSEKFGNDFTPRKALQLLGTESTRKVFGENIWVASAEKRMLQNEHSVISDSRFRNDIENTKRLGGVLVLVQRGELPEWYQTALMQNSAGQDLLDPWQTMESKYPHIHNSEWNWVGTKFDFIINNNGTMEDLEMYVDHVYKTLMIN